MGWSFQNDEAVYTPRLVSPVAGPAGQYGRTVVPTFLAPNRVRGQEERKNAAW
jgi:hypothetical protein